MTADSKLASQVKSSELWLFLVATFKNYPQFPTAFLASSGFISVAVYLALFDINAIDVINTSDIVFNSVVNLILLVPVFYVLVLMAVGWVSADVAVDQAGTQPAGGRRILFYAFSVLRVFWLALACGIVLAALAHWLWPQGVAKAMQAFGGERRFTPLNFAWNILVKLAVATVVLWIAPIVYAFFTTGLLPKGLLTTLILFITANAIVGIAAHQLFMATHSGGSLGFMHRNATNLPDAITQSCPGERDIIWTGDRALVFYCAQTGHRFIFYREYATVVDVR